MKWILLEYAKTGANIPQILVSSTGKSKMMAEQRWCHTPSATPAPMREIRRCDQRWNSYTMENHLPKSGKLRTLKHTRNSPRLKRPVSLVAPYRFRSPPLWTKASNGRSIGFQPSLKNGTYLSASVLKNTPSINPLFPIHTSSHTFIPALSLSRSPS